MRTEIEIKSKIDFLKEELAATDHLPTESAALLRPTIDALEWVLNEGENTKQAPPKYAKIRVESEGTTVKFKMSKTRNLTSASNTVLNRNTKLEPNELMYRTVYGWGVIVDADTLEIKYPEHQFYFGKKITEITEEEYGDGMFA